MKRIIKAAAYLGAVVTLEKFFKSYQDYQNEKRIDASIADLQSRIRTSHDHLYV